MLKLCDAHGPFDVAVGSELLYREDSVSSLVETIQALGVPTVVLAQQTRPAGNFDIEHSTRMMERLGYSVARATIPGCPAVIYTFSEGGYHVRGRKHCSVMVMSSCLAPPAPRRERAAGVDRARDRPRGMGIGARSEMRSAIGSGRGI